MQTLDLEFRQGDTWVKQIQIVDDDGVAIDVTTWTNWLAQSRRESGSALVAELTVEVDDPVEGLVTLSFPETDSDGVAAGVYAWDMQVEKPSGVETIVGGTLTVLGDIARVEA